MYLGVFQKDESDTFCDVEDLWYSSSTRSSGMVLCHASVHSLLSADISPTISASASHQCLVQD